MYCAGRVGRPHVSLHQYVQSFRRGSFPLTPFSSFSFPSHFTPLPSHFPPPRFSSASFLLHLAPNPQAHRPSRIYPHRSHKLIPKWLLQREHNIETDQRGTSTSSISPSRLQYWDRSPSHRQILRGPAANLSLPVIPLVSPVIAQTRCLIFRFRS